MALPDGVAPPAQQEIRKAMARIFKTLSGAASDTKANHLLTGAAADSHRIFISTFIQHSTYAHFAVGDLLAGRVGAWSKTDDWTRVRKHALPVYFGPGVKQFTLDYYSATQCLISRSGPTIELFRGIPKNTAQLLFDDLARPGLKAYLFVDVLSSWSDQKGLALKFAERAGGAVVRLSVPVEMVFAHWLHDDAMEFILRRQCRQHLKSDPTTIGGEVILWAPLRCLEVGQTNIDEDFTQVPTKGKFR